MAPLTNKLISDHADAMNMLDEIRRERTIELYMEGFRYDDLKRWGKMEEELNESRCGMIVGDANYKTDFVDDDGNAIPNMYSPNTFVWGDEEVETGDGNQKAVVIISKSEISVDKKSYLWPIPQRQIDMNPNLKQNPGY